MNRNRRARDLRTGRKPSCMLEETSPCVLEETFGLLLDTAVEAVVWRVVKDGRAHLRVRALAPNHGLVGDVIMPALEEDVVAVGDRKTRGQYGLGVEAPICLEQDRFPHRRAAAHTDVTS